MTGLEIAYLICFFLGLGFAVISALLSGVFAGGDAHVDGSGAPDVHLDHGMTDGDCRPSRRVSSSNSILWGGAAKSPPPTAFQS